MPHSPMPRRCSLAPTPIQKLPIRPGAARIRDRRLPPKPTALGAQLDAAKAELKAKQDAAAAAEAAAKAAEAKRIETAKAATDAKLASEPVAIFISRATHKLYVRRDTHKKWPDGGELYDFSQEFPVTIKDPDKPLGTHIFTAVARAERGLRWTEVSIDNGDSGKNALDRITFPQEVLDRIAPTAVPLSSITISDEPLSGETNYRTEFVAVLSNQPQGGFITREKSPDMTSRAPRITAAFLVNSTTAAGSGHLTMVHRRRGDRPAAHCITRGRAGGVTSERGSNHDI